MTTRAAKVSFKTLKREEIYANKYDNLEHLQANIEEFIEQYYNRQRLHSALGYRSPEEFERENEKVAEKIPRSLWVQQSSSLWTMRTVRTGRGILKSWLGKGTQTPSPFPRPQPLLGDTKA
jgi:Integrase core domain